MRYYVYRHIRLDKNIPFYVGIGTKILNANCYTREYKRAFSREKRTQFWKKVARKGNWKVEIIYESDNHSEILLKEKEFIKMYGRVDLREGTLTNLTDGGDTSIGYRHREDSKKKIAANRKYVHSDDHPNSRIVYQYTLDGRFVKRWESTISAGKYFDIGRIRNCLFGKTYAACDFQWFRDFRGKVTDPARLWKHRKKPVIMFSRETNEQLNIFKDSYEAASYLGDSKKYSGIQKCCAGVNHSAYGYLWKYHTSDNKDDQVNKQ